MLYFDTSNLVRLYLDDAGCELVRELAAQNEIASCWHAQAEILCALAFPPTDFPFPQKTVASSA